MPWVWGLAALPVAVFLALAAVPRGRPALMALIGAAALAGLVTLAFALAGQGSVGLAAGFLSGAAIALAGVAQALRQALGTGRRPWVYPVIVVATLAAGAVPAMRILGS